MHIYILGSFNSGRFPNDFFGRSLLLFISPQVSLLHNPMLTPPVPLLFVNPLYYWVLVPFPSKLFSQCLTYFLTFMNITSKAYISESSKLTSINEKTHFLLGLDYCTWNDCFQLYLLNCKFYNFIFLNISLCKYTTFLLFIHYFSHLVITLVGHIFFSSISFRNFSWGKYKF